MTDSLLLPHLSCTGVCILSLIVALFRDELTEFERNGMLTKLIVSFSRDVSLAASNEIKPPKYVQDNIMIWGEDLCNLIYNSEAFIFVCG